ncbi:MAG: hypothetical protein ABSH29_24770 [Acidimicrobiales bacterium]|jgi:hypothetical protein
MTHRDRYGEPIEEPKVPALRDAAAEAKARQGRGEATEVVAHEYGIGRTRERALLAIRSLRRQLDSAGEARTPSNDKTVSTHSTTGVPS